jgi:hypothetical protein
MEKHLERAMLEILLAIAEHDQSRKGDVSGERHEAIKQLLHAGRFSLEGALKLCNPDSGKQADDQRGSAFDVTRTRRPRADNFEPAPEIADLGVSRWSNAWASPRR